MILVDLSTDIHVKQSVFEKKSRVVLKLYMKIFEKNIQHKSRIHGKIRGCST